VVNITGREGFHLFRGAPRPVTQIEIRSTMLRVTRFLRRS
jgi:hypothetical protein